jgi:hypothetical protein
MQKILLKLIIVAAISSASFAQTNILSFTSSATIAQNPALPWGFTAGYMRPEGSFATVGSNKFLAIAFNYATNNTSFETNKSSGTTSVMTNEYNPRPLGVAYVFKFTSSNVVNPSPVLSLTNTQNHTYSFSGSYISTNSIAISYFTAVVATNVYGSIYTNITTDYWGKETSVLLSTTNNGSTWTTNQTLGSVKTNFIVATGSYVPNPNRSFWVNIVKGTNGKAVFDVYNP